MKSFELRIGTPGGMIYEGAAGNVRCRTVCGEIAIMAGHSNFCTALGVGDAAVTLPDGERKKAVCKAGMLIMMNGVCRILTSSWEWMEE